MRGNRLGACDQVVTAADWFEKSCLRGAQDHIWVVHREHRGIVGETKDEPTVNQSSCIHDHRVDGPQRNPRRTIAKLDDSTAETGIRLEVGPGLHRLARLHDPGA
jgi:hypothetical protein